MHRIFPLAGLVLLFTSGLCAQTTSSQATAFHATMRSLLLGQNKHGREKHGFQLLHGDLAFDDTAGKLIFTSAAYYGDPPKPLEIPYDQVEKAVLETTTHMRGYTRTTALISGLELPGLIAGNHMAAAHVTSQWLYLRYKDPDGTASRLMEVPKDFSTQLIDKATHAFGTRVSIVDFPEQGTEINLKDLESLKSKQEFHSDKLTHPLPEAAPDKATVVVVCPFLGTPSHAQFRLHANNEVVAMNEIGTYSFAYLNPGKYRLVSQWENANGFEMQLEAGQEYYFLQNAFQQGLSANESILSRNSPELTMFFVNGSYYADWKPKK